jgi:hypothetical protein
VREEVGHTVGHFNCNMSLQSASEGSDINLVHVIGVSRGLSIGR